MAWQTRLCFLLSLALGACGGIVPHQTAPDFSEVDPSSLDDAELRLLWEQAMDHGDWQTALAARQQWAERAPEQPERQLAVARALHRAGQSEEAMRVARKLTGEERTAESATVFVAELHLAEGRYTLAGRLFVMLATAAEDRDDEHAARSHWERAARMAELDGDDKLAVEYLQNALDGVPLRDSERRLLDRLQAFQGGEFQHVDDAATVLRRHEDPRLRYDAALFLAAAADEVALAALADALMENDPRIPLLAIPLLVDAEARWAVSSLESALGHAAVEVRLAATEALGQLADRASAPILLDRLEPEHRSLFRAQCQALERLTGHVLQAPFDADLEARQALGQAWQEWWQAQG